MSTDSQGRPLSDDGQWAWNGTEWVPAAGGADAAQAAVTPEDAGATMIAPSPFAGGGQPGFGGAPAAEPSGGYGGAPGYGGGSTPGYSGDQGFPPAGGYGGAPGYGGGPAPQKSNTTRIALIIGGIVVIAAIVVVLIITLGGSKKSSASPSGKFTCRVPGSTQTGTITFNGSNYSLSDKGKSGSFAVAGTKVTFAGGSLDKATATYTKSSHKVAISFQGATLTCT